MYPCPTPTPTVTVTRTSSLKHVYIQRCCSAQYSIQVVVQTDEDATIGDIIVVDGKCHTIIGLNAPDAGDYHEVSNYSDCTDCETYYPCPTPTPSLPVSPTVTRTNTPTPTNSPTFTQTPTASGEVFIDIDLGVDYETGSTIAYFTVTASTAVSELTTITFDNILYQASDPTKTETLRGRVDIQPGETIGTGSTTSTKDLSIFIPYQVSYENIQSGRGNSLRNVNKYTKVVFPETSPLTVYYQFVNCCWTDVKNNCLKIFMEVMISIRKYWMD